MNLLRMKFLKYQLSRFEWYRKWYGGRWENHYIDICHSDIWFDIDDPSKMWPKYKKPCSKGTPKIEDW